LASFFDDVETSNAMSRNPAEERASDCNDIGKRQRNGSGDKKSSGSGAGKSGKSNMKTRLLAHTRSTRVSTILGMIAFIIKRLLSTGDRLMLGVLSAMAMTPRVTKKERRMRRIRPQHPRNSRRPLRGAEQSNILFCLTPISPQVMKVRARNALEMTQTSCTVVPIANG
jgi:hypothetical protein